MSVACGVVVHVLTHAVSNKTQGDFVSATTTTTSDGRWSSSVLHATWGEKTHGTSSLQSTKGLVTVLASLLTGDNNTEWFITAVGHVT
jgi:hypothetical protein